MRVAVSSRLIIAVLVTAFVGIGTKPAWSQDAIQPGASSAQGDDSPLQPGDMIRLLFGREPDLNGDYTVDVTGDAVLPLLGRQHVTGVPASELKEKLVAEYDAQLRNQAVQVVLLRRVRVLGAVQKPGLYHADLTMTLGDVVALAGGATSNGNQEEIKILRDGQELRSHLTTTDAVISRLHSGDQIMVPEKSWFSRNSRWLIGSTVSIGAFALIRALTN